MPKLRIVVKQPKLYRRPGFRIRRSARRNLPKAVSVIAARVRAGETKWPVKTGASRRGFYTEKNVIKNYEDYAVYVHPKGKKTGASMRAVEQFAKREVPKELRRLIERDLNLKRGETR